MPQTIEGAFAKGAREMIVVLPDSKTVHNGSMYSSSVTTGDFENFVARDVVSYIDAHYRTMAERESRGLVGHSMGGYGATRIGMKHADVFGSLYIMSPCCLSLARGSGRRQPGERRSAGSRQDASGLREAALRLACPARVGGGVVAEPEESAALSRSADRTNQQDGAGEVGRQRAAGVCRSVRPDLRQYRAIAIDVGDQDGLTRRRRQAARRARSVTASRTTFEIYPGTHTSDVAVRFQEHVMPFFSRTLSFEPAKR